MPCAPSLSLPRLLVGFRPRQAIGRDEGEKRVSSVVPLSLVLSFLGTWSGRSWPPVVRCTTRAPANDLYLSLSLLTPDHGTLCVECGANRSRQSAEKRSRHSGGRRKNPSAPMLFLPPALLSRSFARTHLSALPFAQG